MALAACQKGYSVAFTTAAALVHELMEARDERRLRALQKHLNTVKLLIVNELGYVPFTGVGSELLFEVFSQRYERGSTLVTSNLPFDEETSIFGSERLTGALLDRLTHHVHILEMNGESYRLATSKKAQRAEQPGILVFSGASPLADRGNAARGSSLYATAATGLMNPKDGTFTMGFERFNALLTWRGYSDARRNGGLD